MKYSVVTLTTELPKWLSIEKMAVFLNEVMKPYEDTEPDIISALNYALSSKPGQGGFIVLALNKTELAGAVVILNTGMSGYVPANLLLFIAVRPELRGQGIGSKLIEMVKERCTGEIKLHVEPDNPAKHLYERQGFSNKYLEMRLLNK